jgi:hypothetical protein
VPVRNWSALLLRAAVGLGGLVPVSAGLAGVLLGPAMLGEAAGTSADSHHRYLSGLLLGVGLGFWTTIPRIEAATLPFRLLTGIVVLGGLGRLVALGARGLPDAPMLAGLLMELLVTPLLCLWQARVASASERDGGGSAGDPRVTSGNPP